MSEAMDRCEEVPRPGFTPAAVGHQRARFLFQLGNGYRSFGVTQRVGIVLLMVFTRLRDE